MIADWQPWRELGVRAAVLLVIICGGAAVWPRCYPLARGGWIQCGALALLLFPLTLLLPGIAWRVLPAPFEQVAASPRQSPAIARSPADSPRQTATALDRGNATNALPNGLDSLPASSTMRPLPPATPLSGISVSETIEPAWATHTTAKRAPIGILSSADTSGTTLAAWPLMLAGTYGFGLIFSGVRLALGLRQLQRLRSRAPPCERLEWQSELALVRDQLRLPKNIELRVSTKIASPWTSGHRQPTIMLPAKLVDNSSSAERRAILWHELTHIERHDYAWQLLVRCVQALWWFQPLAWLLGRQLTVAQERICDGVCVARVGAGPYAQTLINVARQAQASPRQRLAVSMARSGGLARRLTRIAQQPGLERSRASPRMLASALAVVAGLGFGCGTLQPVRGEAPAITPTTATPSGPPSAVAAQAPKTETTQTSADESTGDWQTVLLRDAQNDKPLTNTTVRLRRQVMQSGSLKILSAPRITEQQTNEHGELRVRIEEFSREERTAFTELTIEGYAPLQVFAPEFEDRQQTEPDVEYCWRGATEWSTRVFDTDGQPAENAWMIMEAHVQTRWWVYYLNSDADGRVRCRLPQGLRVGLTTGTSQGAPFRLAMPAGTATTPDIHLRPGAIVSGQLLDRQGEPLPGRVIVMEVEDSQAEAAELQVERYGGSIELEAQRRTDAEGRFRFNPRVGPVRISLQRDSAQAPREQLLPAYLELAPGGDHWLPLMTAPTGKISGVLRTADGKPVTDCEIQLLLHPHRSNAYLTLATTRSNAAGEYELDAPYPLEKALLQVVPQWTDDGKQRVARPAANADATANYYEVKHYIGKPLTVDWVTTLADASVPTDPRKSTPIPAQWQPLADLENEIRDTWHAYEQAKEATQTPEQLQHVQSNLDPMDRLVARCLEFESSFRGTRMAIGALHYVMLAAGSYPGGQTAVDRDHAVELLKQHYLEHPDVDMLINSTGFRNTVGSGESLLSALAENSPYDYVRATALLELARIRFGTAQLGEMLANAPPASPEEIQNLREAQTSPEALQAFEKNMATVTKLRAELSKTPVEELRNGALDLIDRITTNYSRVEAPWRKWASPTGSDDEPRLQLVERTDDWNLPSLLEEAETLRFQQTRLRDGQVAPEIEGRDLQQHPIRLSQFRGKVVLLTFSRGESSHELYAQCAKLMEMFPNLPFTCLSVIPGEGDGGFSALSIVESHDITWPIIRDSHRDDLGRRWRQITFPEAYLLDADGKIVRHLAPCHDLTHLRPLIDHLLREAAKSAPAGVP